MTLSPSAIGAGPPLAVSCGQKSKRPERRDIQSASFETAPVFSSVGSTMTRCLADKDAKGCKICVDNQNLGSSREDPAARD